MTERIILLDFANPELVARCVDAIPDSWSDVTGHLYAPDAELTSGRALRHAGYRMGRFQHYIEIKVEPNASGPTNEEEQILLGDKAPGFIEFQETGYGNPEKFQRAKRIVSRWIRRGYIPGWLHFASGVNREFSHENPITIIFERGPWRHIHNAEMPSAMVIQVNEKLGGRFESLAPVFAVSDNLPSA
jgi:hypothetical protein